MSIIGIVNCGISNMRSVMNALDALGLSYKSILTSKDLDACSHIILPGDGSFNAGMEGLKEAGLIEALKRAAREGKYILGICLGMQLLAAEGYEFGLHEGLGIIPGRVVPLNPENPALPVPQIGWNQVTFSAHSRILKDLGGSATYYFMHSYVYENSVADYVVGSFDYPGREVAIVEQGNVFGVQFHPEKSHNAGLELLRKFAELSH